MSDFGQRQQRNGDDLGVETRETGQSDWVGTISSMADQAKAAGAYRLQQSYDMAFDSPFGSGSAGGEYVNPGGSMWDWDGGLAIAETPGEWSQPGVHANNSPNANTPPNVTGKGGS